MIFSFQKELENDAWIQCEHEDCLKWRRVNAEVAEEYDDEPWYCEFNTDKEYNRYVRVEARVQNWD